MTAGTPNPDGPADSAAIEVQARRYDHQRGGDWPGNRGLMVEARRARPGSGVFSAEFPTVFISDSIDVGMDDGRWPITEFLAWIEAIRPHLIEAAGRVTSSQKDGDSPR